MRVRRYVTCPECKRRKPMTAVPSPTAPTGWTYPVRRWLFNWPNLIRAIDAVRKEARDLGLIGSTDYSDWDADLLSMSWSDLDDDFVYGVGNPNHCGSVTVVGDEVSVWQGGDVVHTGDVEGASGALGFAVAYPDLVGATITDAF